MNKTTEHLLRSALEASVPLHALAVSQMSFDERQRIAHNAAQVVAEKGDIIQYRSKRAGETAAAFNALALGLTVLSFQPGGVKFLGLRWIDGEAQAENEAGCRD